MEQILSINPIDLFLHLDKYLAIFVEQYGAITYLVLFLVIFCETGLVVTPFLPGDSLLFVAGSIAAVGKLDVNGIALLLLAAAVLGDACNYAIGHFIGPKVFALPHDKFWGKYVFRKEYLDRTHRFYEKYGAKTIVLARFVPIVRTFAPFLAGVGTMTYPKFAAYNICGGALWVGMFIYGGYFFSSIPIIQKNFSVVVVVIILISVMPIAYEFWKAKRANRN